MICWNGEGASLVEQIGVRAGGKSQEMRIRFLFYEQERIVSSTCMKLGELLDLIARGYPGSRILGIEVIETTSNANRPRRHDPPKAPESSYPVFCDRISIA